MPYLSGMKNLVPVCLLILFFLACHSTPEPTRSGAELAKIYCSSCHQFPDPGLLDKKSWEQHMLPRMGYMLGIYPKPEFRATLIENGPGGARVEAANIYPKSPTLDLDQWKAIQAYYLAEAPEQLKLPKPLPITKDLRRFIARIPDTRLSPPSTTLVKFNADGSLYLGDAHTKSLLHFSPDLDLLKMGKVREGAVHVHEQAGNLWITNMGSFSPTDAATGEVVVFPAQGPPAVAIKDLQRPVHTSYGDLDQDRQEDLVIAEFGKWTGRISWWRRGVDGRFAATTISNRSGAIKTYLRDMNDDGRMDVIALFGQGNEGIYWFENRSNGTFVQHLLLQFPASYGSSNFRLLDANNDGAFDILYTAGDNADFGPILKPYHGIRLFLNNGQNAFTEAWFVPLAGAYDAYPADFDHDGDLDLAAISFFPDFQHQPEAGFVYLENQGDFHFTYQTFPQVEVGRWIVMDAGDPDQDGDLDLVLGSLAFEVIPKGDWIERWVQGGIPMVFLENQTD